VAFDGGIRCFFCFLYVVLILDQEILILVVKCNFCFIYFWSLFINQKYKKYDFLFFYLDNGKTFI